MDFDLDDEHQAISDLADRILGEQAGEAAWGALAAADLLAVALPESAGGSGLGTLAAGLVARQAGRHVARVPYWPAAAAARCVARCGGAALAERWLPGAGDGRGRLTVARWGDASAVAAGNGWELHGTSSPVPWARGAAALVVATPEGAFVVDAGAPGVELVDEQVITGEPAHTVTLRGVPADRLGDGPGSAEVLAQQCTALLAMTMLGVCEEALAMTARYVSQREQFGAPIGTFQAVAHRCADAYIDTEAVRLSALQAAWQVDAGWDATEALATAAFWACEAGHRVVHAAQHLHGGIGFDTDYPLHRYYRWAKYLEGLLGGPHAALADLRAALSAGASSET
jgi:alkylation response protein AidB-like acyl-CoA dehydrogenase